jgi:hypothetical protein
VYRLTSEPFTAPQFKRISFGINQMPFHLKQSVVAFVSPRGDFAVVKWLTGDVSRKGHDQIQWIQYGKTKKRPKGRFLSGL